jgi:pimeloyl-ACP methyl ester carboxylesterase
MAGQFERAGRVRSYSAADEGSAFAAASADLASLAAEGFFPVARSWDATRGLLTIRFEQHGPPTASPPAGTGWVMPSSMHPAGSGWALAPPAPPTRRWRVLVALFFVGILGALSITIYLLGTVADAPSPRAPIGRPAAGPVPRLEPGECRFETYDDREVKCGDLIVPEARDVPESQAIRLHYAVFKSDDPSPEPDPVVYLEGGPGYGALGSVPYELDLYPFLAERDFVVFDQRGTGYSDPLLDCPELNGFDIDTGALGGIAAGMAYARAIEGCRKALTDAGVLLEEYRSAQSAADVEDLREALGYEQWNLYGISYGTRLALTVMRDHPAGVRSAILDSVVPVEVDFLAEAAPNADRAMALVFESCQRDPVCDREHPRLREVFEDAVEALDDEPVTLDVETPDGETEQVEAVGADLIEFFFIRLYDTTAIPALPRHLEEIAGGDYTELESFLSQQMLEQSFADPDTDRATVDSEALYYSMVCGEEAAFTTRAAIRQRSASVSRAIADAFGTSFIDECELWDVGASPAIEQLAVESDIPTLLLAGEFDPITPPAWAETAARGLSTAWTFVLPATGHGVLASRGCAAEITRDFLARPERIPGVSCLSGIQPPAYLADGEYLVDDFSEPRSGWYTDAADEGTVAYVDGGYEIHVKEEDASWYGEPLSFPPPDVRVEATVQRLVAGDGGHWGIMCRAQDDGDHYLLGMNELGSWVIVKVSGRGERILASGETQLTEGAIAAGVRLAASCTGGEAGGVALELRIDGRPVGSATDQSGFADGWVGLSVSTGSDPEAHVRFDDFAILEP